MHTGEDPYVGRLSLLRIFSGTLRPDTTVHLADRPDERITALSSPFGRQQRPMPLALPGDLVSVAKLTGARTGDTLTTDGALIPPWPLPEALLPCAVEAHSKADEDKLSQALARLAAQDPTLRVEQNPDTHQLVLWCTGEAHLGVLLDRLRTRYGVHVDSVPYEVALRETFGSAASGHGRHVKQSGGHGQYAICDLTVEPLPGGGFEFVDKVVGGSVPRNFIPSVEKGVRAQLLHGIHGHPMVDVRVTLTDGKAHSVDSSDAAFQTAGALALREGRLPGQGPTPGTGRRGADPAARRVPGRRPQRPLLAPRPRPRHRERRARHEPGPGRGPRARTHPLPPSSCAPSPTAPASSPAATSATPRCPPTWPASTNAPPDAPPGSPSHRPRGSPMPPAGVPEG
ncbi:hypothetical protein FHR36_001978 [Kitasatospora paracochleata]|uniref:Translation elongation factor EFG/EF2 domain-containing protein n=1 Tax=Kitasatospora paracochleata TaxID=58354 RepID=A0ABT1IUU8_9ACTN|nr:hypothetical protein [Kitasatospora paracochleata]